MKNPRIIDWTQALLLLLGIGLVICGVVLIVIKPSDHKHTIPAIGGVVFTGASLARNGAKKTISKNQDEVMTKLNNIEKRLDKVETNINEKEKNEK